MAKYYISADLEGVCGVSSLLQCYPKEDQTGYQAAVNQLALEINTVAKVILQEDPTAENLVNDAHSTMTNLTLAHLSPQIALLSGKPKVCAMMSGLDESFKGAFFIGYHARAGVENSVLNHTFHSKLFDVKVNGKSYGEGEINALYASLTHQVPVLLASGDRAFCQEIKTVVPNIHTVETKIGITTTAAQCHPQESVMRSYQEQTRNALQTLKKGQGSLPSENAPFTLQITFINTLACDVAMTSPLYKRLEGRTIEMTTDNFKTLYQGLQSAYTMLSYTHYME